MAHLHNLIHGIADVSNNGYYHNLKFKETAEAHGLHIEKHDKYGWTVTTLTEKTAAWLAATLGGDEFNVSRQPEGGGNGKTAGRKSKNRSIKYVCPECGTIIRATREVSVICGDCGVEFERE
jgi:rubrerythrin